MIYFKNFPKVQYDVFRDGKQYTLVNTTKRFAPIKSLLNNAVLYYPYKIRDGQRPEIVSHIMYNTTDYDWIIILFNTILDPYYEWPLSYNEFNQFLENKYGSIAASTQTIKEYRMIVTPYEKLYDGTVIEEDSLVIDHDTYLNLEDFKRKIVYAYDYEVQLNDKRKNINILDKVYIPQLLKEKEKIFDVIKPEQVFNL